VLVAGGIGLAPLRPALYHLLTNREKYGRIILFYGARTPQELLFTRELERWRARFDLDIAVTVDRATGDWRGNVGVVTTLIPRAPFDPANTVVAVCGPEVMMRFAVMELEKRGVPSESIYLSMERNMKCGIGFCGHCQFGPAFLCKDGPVFRYDRVRDWLVRQEI
jgi:NAD(P)H-flavin reductase